MPSNIYDAYATKICRHAGLPAGCYSAHDLTAIIMQLPLGEAHAALDGVEHAALPRLGETVTIQAHMQKNFFDVLGMAGRELFAFTVPVLIRRDYLERLEGWREWRVLALYLGQSDLEPLVVFRNTPIAIKTGLLEETVYYVADVRVACAGENFEWQQ
ncbi:hypothetical protein [Jiella pacifica]|uniref:Uncharacterized protein n=1 Tax=Jiella pacifica TaxID=2696469 RepID=A0A6N9TCG9_9HYPH|nr:hypothetical protein [Jiella pacifica]NDW07786.1 hypothetical protein [Jiella pacifica]